MWRTSTEGHGSLSPVAVGRGIRDGAAAFVCSLAVLSLVLAIEVAVGDAGFGGFGGQDRIRILTALVSGNFYAVHLGAYDVAEVETLLSIYEVVPDPALLPVVVGVLWAFGCRSVASSAARFDPLAGAIQGGSIAVGYAAGTVASLAVASVLLGTDAGLVTSEAVRIVVVAGVGYPAICGAGGGIAAVMVSDQPDRE